MGTRRERVNLDRARKAVEALESYGLTEDSDRGEIFTVAQDLLADLLHLANPQGAERRLIPEELAGVTREAWNQYYRETRQE